MQFQKDKKLAALMLEMERLKNAISDDEEDEYDDEEYDDDEDMSDIDMHCLDVFSSSLMACFGGLEKPKESENVKERNSVDMNKTNIDTVIRAVKPEVGVTKIVASPGSGKTSVFPEKYNDIHGNKVCVVVPNDTILASVVAQNDFSWVDKNIQPHGDCGSLFYLSCETFNEIHLNKHNNVVQEDLMGSVLSNDTVLIFDESQFKDEYGYTVNKYSKMYNSNNTVIQMHGSYSDRETVLPKNVSIEDVANFKIENEERVLILYPRIVDAQNGFRKRQSENGFFLDNSSVDDMIKTLRICSGLEKYVLHADAGTVIGLDLPNLTCVVGVKEYMLDSKLVVTTRNQHVQFMNRAGRRGGDVKYFIKRGTIPQGFDKTTKEVCNARIDKMFELIGKVKLKPLSIANKRKSFLHRKKKSESLNNKACVISVSPKSMDLEKSLARRAVTDVTKIEMETTTELNDAFARAVTRKHQVLVKKANERTQVILGTKPFKLFQLACLPETITGVIDHGRYFEVDSIRANLARGFDISEEIVVNYNYILSSADRFVNKCYSSRTRYDRKNPFFYNLYLDMYDFITELNLSNCVYLPLQRYYEVDDDGGKILHVMKLLPFGTVDYNED